VSNASSGDTVDFALTCSVITLTSGDIEISRNLTINGPGASALAVSGDNASQVFAVDSSVTATISGLTIENGSTSSLTDGQGAGIVSNGTLKLNNAYLVDNDAYIGGGVQNSGTLTITNSILSHNTGSYIGGGIDNTGTLTVADSTISGNSSGEGGGGINTFGGGSGTVSNSTVSDNNGEYGGGIQALSNFTVSDSTLSDNMGSFGGGIYDQYGTLTVTGSNFSGNAASQGGGAIDNNGTLTATDSTFSNNRAAGQGGGGIENGGCPPCGTLTIGDSTFSDNSATGAGGGIQNGGIAAVSESTLSGNTATTYGGGIANGSGVSPNTLTVVSSTLSGNSASNGGGVSDIASGTVNTVATIVANTTSGDDCYGSLTDGGYNLDDDGSCGFTSTNHSISGSMTVDLGPLANNGGPTETLLPKAASSAVGVIPNPITLNGVAVCPRTDQRGVASASGVNCTIGAVEVDQVPTTSILIPSKGTTLSGVTSLDASATNATSVEFRLIGGTYGFSAPVICTATPTLYGWLCAWNTTTVPNGSYVLVSEALNGVRSTFSSGVSITVGNPPTARVVIPSNGATLSGSTYLDASAPNATSVELRLIGGIYGFSGPVVCTAPLTLYGWLCAWNTATVPNGSYVLVSEAFNSYGSAFSSGVSIIIKN
jgi:hypothetical protein